MRALLTAILVLVLTASTGLAQTPNFPDWERQYAAEGVQILSPKDERRLAVAFAITIAAESAGDPREDFSSAVADLIAGLGAQAETVERSGLAESSGMILEAVKLKRNDGVMVDLLIAAYPVAGGKWQIVFLMYPSSLPDSDPRVVHALDFLATAFNAGFSLVDPQQFDATAPAAMPLTTVTDAREPAPAPEAPAQPPTQAPQGHVCEERPVWGAQISTSCLPSGVCNNLVAKKFEMVCR